jgi:hypothetical protein
MLCFAALAVCLPKSGEGSPPVYNCPKVAVPPVIDGKLDDDAWKRAPEVTFVLCTTGEPITKSTRARMCWDNECLYIAYECADTDIWGTMTKRDDPVFQEEVVEAFIDPDCDLRYYYEFNVSPRNVIFDAFISNPDGMNPDDKTQFGWNCDGVRSAVVVDGTLDDRTDTDRGWTCELAIPFAGLERKTPKPGERWRANLYRIDLTPKPAEFQAWSPTLCTPPRFHVPSRFGTIFFSAAGGCP